ncbi:MAG: hypothetical protein HQL20_04215 [Candidatus Omnitrophica bacterium]|nr:hypothetical protein [Candidatus Omnitrophota bacterium]
MKIRGHIPLCLLGAVFALWTALHWSSFTGKAFFSGDNGQYFYWLTYHFDNLTRGVYPFWNPFHAWGSVDNFDVRFLGEFNPFYWIIPFLGLFRVSAAAGFQAFIILYFFLGCLGFFALARKLCRNDGLAVLACAMLLFSALGERVFTQLAVLITLVPAIWFFNELTGFYQEADGKFQIRRILGLFFWTMIMAVSYIPFFFILVMLAFLAGLLIFNRKVFPLFFGKLIAFVRRYPLIILAGVLSLSAALVPVTRWYLASRDSQYVLLVDRAEVASADKARVPLSGINAGSLCVVTSWPEWFADLDITQQTFSYVTNFLVVLLILVVATRCAPAQRVVFLTGLLVFMVGAADVFPLHQFLYDHVYMFQLFRNYYFLWPFVIAIFILFAVGQLKVWLDGHKPAGRSRWLFLALILLVHLALGALLWAGDGIVLTSYIMLALSALVFSGYVLGWYGQGNWLTFGLLAAALVQPCQVLPGFRILADPPREWGIHEAKFSYVRPRPGTGFNEDHGFHSRTKIMQDESGFVKAGYMGVKYSYDLSQHLPSEALAPYVKNKFVLYKGVSFLDPNSGDWGRVEAVLSGARGSALVYDRQALRAGANSGAARVVTGPSEDLRVTDFNVNGLTVQTALAERAFLVYNDSYHKDWRATLDGQDLPVYRANAAFKGVWVEPGRHTIRWQFMPGPWQAFYLFLTFLFAAWSVVVLLTRFSAQRLLV